MNDETKKLYQEAFNNSLAESCIHYVKNGTCLYAPKNYLGIFSYECTLKKNEYCLIGKFLKTEK